MMDRTTAEQTVVGGELGEPPERATLVLHHGDGATVAPLSPGQSLTVGRQFPAELVAEDQSLSRQHARFQLRDGELWVEDLGSRNGTWVAGTRVQRARLRSGEPVRLGAATAAMHVMVGDPAPPDGEGAGGGGHVLRSPTMLELYARIRQVAPTTVPVLILGETGTGKEHVAHALHEHSDRSQRPMRVINCAAIPEGLAESLLFGHERGAFTGAHTASQGLFEQADGGTLFLDEVGELTPANQAALLRTLESRSVHPIGSRRTIQVDVRVIAATHRDLAADVAAGRFREDLYYRLNALTLRVPPLRARPEELEPLARHFLAQAALAWGRPARPLGDDARALLSQLPWPGNIRQLRNAMEHATLVCRGDRIEVGDLPGELLEQERIADAATEGAAAPPASVAVEGAPTTVPPSSSPRPPEVAFRDRVREYETRLIVDALRATGGNQRAAARMLAIPLRTLAHKMKSHGIRERMRAEGPT